MSTYVLEFLIRKLRPQEGYLVGVLLVTAVLCLPWSVAAAGWLPGAPALLPIGLVAMLVGLRMGRGWRPGVKLGLTALLGIVGVALWLAGALPSLLALIEMGIRSVSWLVDGRVGEWPGMPLWRTASAAATDFWLRLIAWGQSTQSGRAGTDTLPILWLGGVVVWLSAVWAGWAFRRWRRPGLAILPIGFLTTQHLVFAANVNGQYAVFLGAVIGLLAQGRYLALSERWEREKIDYSDEVRLDTTVVTAIMMVLIPALVWLIPLPTLYGPARAAWEAFRVPREAAGELAKRALGPIQRPPSGGLFGTTDLSELPLSRVLAGPPDLRDQIMLRVRTSDPPVFAESEAPPRHYWRIETLDTYTGRGWENGLVSERRVAGVSVASVFAALPSQARLTQRYILVSRIVPPVVNDPIAIDQDYTRVERGPDDLASLRLNASSYTVVSRLPTATEAQLRSLEPPRLERYVRLPGSVPQRVRDLARSITQTAPTAYDRALAIQAYLRELRYDLEVPAAPVGRDVTDYLLFDLRAGYCDYMATAMVVMLREVGIPARLAVGYASGRFDRDIGEYIVSGRDAHAWPEVFFPGVGWVEFEPTPSQAIIERPLEETPLELTEPLVVAPDTTTPRSSLWPWLLGLVGVAFVLAVVSLVQRWRFMSLAPAGQILAIWRRITRQAGWLGHGPAAAQTANEFADQLGADLARHSVQVGGLTWLGQEGQRPLREIAERYTELMYAPHPPGDREAQATVAAWERLRRVLWLFLKDRLP